MSFLLCLKERNNIFHLKLTVICTKISDTNMLVTRTSTGVFPRAIRGNGLRGLQSHLDTLRFFLRPYFIRVNYPTIPTKKQVNLIVYEFYAHVKL